MVPQSLPPHFRLIYAKNNYTPWSFTPGASKGAPWGVLWELIMFEQYFCGSLMGSIPDQLQGKLVLSVFISNGSGLMEASTYHGKRGWHSPACSRNSKVNWSSSPIQNALWSPWSTQGCGPYCNSLEATLVSPCFCSHSQKCDIIQIWAGLGVQEYEHCGKPQGKW